MKQFSCSEPYFHPQSFCIIPRHATFREPIPSSRVSGLCQFCFVLIASVLSFCTLLIMSLWQFSRLGSGSSRRTMSRGFSTEEFVTSFACQFLLWA